MKVWRFPKTLLALLAVVVLLSACSTSVTAEVAEVADAADVAESTEPVESTEEERAAVPTPAGTAERSSESQSASQPAVRVQTATSIRDIDFANFTYDTLLDFGAGTATVVDGGFENGQFDEEDYYWFGVGDIAFGDLDNDGIEEAAVVTTWNSGGTGYFDTVRVYRLVDGVAERVGDRPFGDRALGGVHDVRIADGTVRVLVYGDDTSACCPTQVEERTLVLGEHTLAEAGRTDPQTWFSLNDSGIDAELKFLPGTSSAVISLYAMSLEGSLRFEAGAGQQLAVVPIHGPSPTSIVLEDLTTGQVLNLGSVETLPTSGFYTLTVAFDGPRDEATSLQLVIDGGDQAPEVTWTAAVDQVLVDEDPFVRTSVVWPVFSSPQTGVDAANDALANYATGLDDDWIVGVTEYDEPLDDSSYDATFDVTLATSDLVSVRFNYFDYVCCRPYPNYGQRAAVLDLAAGRLIPAAEILDLSRVGEINAVWFAEGQRQDVIPAELIVEGEDVVRFDSISLTPEGVEFGTDRGSLGGGLPGTSTVVPFDLLGDLVDAGVVARAQQ